MIDIESSVFTAVADALREKFPNITVESVTTYSPSKFPFVCIEEADNYSYKLSMDSGRKENHAVVMYEVNAYSNKASGKKAECKAIIAAVDEIMIGLGFTRNTKNPISMDNATKYRIFARYSAVVSKFYQQLPFYLSIGMTYDQYWNDDSCLVKYYRKAHELKRKERNQELWLQGLYFYNALCDASPLLQAFAKKGTKPLPYPDQPYALTSKELKEHKEREKRMRADCMKAKMAAWAAKTNIQMAVRAEKKVMQNG